MAHLKFTEKTTFFWFILLGISSSLCFNYLNMLEKIKVDRMVFCLNLPVKSVDPLPRQLEKIKSARRMFKKNPNVLEPTYLIKQVPCYNATATLGTATLPGYIIFSGELVDDFSLGEFAGIMAHEFGHLESKLQARQQMIQHYKIDAIAVELVGKTLMLNALQRLKLEQDIFYANHRMKSFIFPAYYQLEPIREEVTQRINRLEALPD